jgi:hypothetical protein
VAEGENNLNYDAYWGPCRGACAITAASGRGEVEKHNSFVSKLFAVTALIVVIISRGAVITSTTGTLTYDPS